MKSSSNRQSGILSKSVCVNGHDVSDQETALYLWIDSKTGELRGQCRKCHKAHAKTRAKARARRKAKISSMANHPVSSKPVATAPTMADKVRLEIARGLAQAPDDLLIEVLVLVKGAVK